jgi:predicted CXXCH cytochrome family protein
VRRILAPVVGAMLGLGLSLVFVVGRVSADSSAQGPVENSFCLACHGNPDLRITLPNGDTQSLYIDVARYANSVHGQENQRCVDCHTNITGYPHPPLVAADHRDYALRLYPLCRACHTEQYEQTLDSMHARALAGGQREAAICTDCHGAHYVEKPAQSHAKISETCAQCHSAIFNEYKESVHGAALLEQGNPDVPTCISCHGVHNIEDPTTAAFRLKSPQICGKCHADKQLMAKYGLSTNVFQTYVADFHGTTVTLFERQSPDQPSNKAVCFDCHGIHDIKSTRDPNSQVVRENLLKTCQQCHPDATTNFPASWTSHYEPSRTRYPLVYFVDLFYRLLIPSIIGFFVVFIGVDATRRVLDRRHSQGD